MQETHVFNVKYFLHLMLHYTSENVKSKCKKSLENFLSGIILAK